MLSCDLKGKGTERQLSADQTQGQGGIVMKPKIKKLLIYRRTQTMNKGISKEMEIREVMKWQLLIAGAVDAAIKGTESYIRHMELTRQQGERRDCS